MAHHSIAGGAIPDASGPQEGETVVADAPGPS